MFATVTTWIVIVLHLVFAYGETIGWTGMARRFGYTREATETTRALALNQGCYNAGLAALLAWALLSGEVRAVMALLIYVIAMAVVGALSVRWTIFVLQGVPAVLALTAHFMR
jgi:putative membrane protein